MDAGTIEVIAQTVGKVLPVVCVFGMPVALVWLKKHYNALEKGHIVGQLPEGVDNRIRALERQRADLEARIQTLESIVTSQDYDRNALIAAAADRPALPAPSGEVKQGS